jgi:hypothetical protein
VTTGDPPLRAEGSAAPDSIGAEGLRANEVRDPVKLEQLLEVANVTRHRELYRSVFKTVLDLVDADTDTLDLKIAAAALAEMAEAFRVFQPYRSMLRR